MKRILLKVLCTIACISSVYSTYGQCGNILVGTSNYVLYSSLSDMAIAPDDKLYTFAYNTSLSQYQLHAAYATGSWSLVATLSGFTTVKPDIQVSKTGKVSVFLRDDLDGGRGKVFTLSGTTFTAIGAAISTSSVSNLSLAFDLAGKECVAYTDITNSNKSTVKQWNGTTSWDNVGSGTVSVGGGFFNSLIIDKNDKFVLAFQDANSGNKTNVMRYNAGAWTSIGIVGSTASNCKLKEASNGNYYLGFTETSNSAVVQKYNGSSWSAVGTAIGSITSAANTFDMELDAVDAPYLLAISTFTPDIILYRFAFSSWSNVTSFSNPNTNILSMSIDKTGTPFLFYVNISANNGLNVKSVTSPVSITYHPASTIVCNGISGSFTFATSGGSPTYQWQTATANSYTTIPGATSSSYSTPPGTAAINQNTFRCIVNDGCKNIISDAATLSVISPTLTLSPTNATCNNTPNGSVTTTVGGGSGSYLYSWSGGQNTANISGLYGNTYTLNVTDQSFGCIITETVTVGAPPPIYLSFTGNSSNICPGSSATITASASGGVGAYTFSWTPSASLSSSTGSVVLATPGSSTTYTVQATDANGCVGTSTVQINLHSNNPTISANTSANTICAGTNVTLTSSGTNVDTYLWNPGNLSGASQNVMPSVGITTYTVTGTNTTTGCQAKATVAITTNSNPTASAGPTRTLTCANTSTTLAGSTAGGTSYNWTGPGIVSGSITLNPTINAPGTYNLYVVSAFGCSSSISSVIVSQNTVAPTPTASNGGVLTCANTTVALNGSPGTGVTYLWTGPGVAGSPTTQNSSANAAGTYTLRVTSSVNGCTNTAVTSVTQNTTVPSPTANNLGPLTCSTTSVTLNGTPATGVSYLWSGPGITGSTTTQNTQANTAGTYTLKVTNAANGCTNTAVTTVTQNTVAPTASANNTGFLTCVTTSAGLTGGPATTVTYLWSGPGITGSTTTQTTTANAVGNYTLIVTSSVNGCTSTAVTSLTQNTVAPSPTSSNTGPLTCTTTSVTLNGTPATGVTYLWSGPGITGSTITQSTTANVVGTYTLKVTNSVNGCTNTAVTSVTQNTVIPNANAGMDQTITCSSPNVILSGTAVPSSCTPVWAGPVTSGANSFNATTTTSGNYILTVTDPANGCSSNDMVTVTSSTSIPTITVTVSNSLTCANISATISATTSAALPTYAWSGPGIVSGSTTSNPVANQPGVYTVTVTDVPTGCINTATIGLVADANIPTLTTSFTNTLTCADLTANVTVTTSTSDISYSWTGPGIVSGAATSIATVNQPGTYSIIVTNTINGCSNTTAISVPQDITQPSLNISPSATVICSGASATISITGADTYTWSSGANTTIITVSPTTLTTYTVIGTATNGCTNTATQQIDVNALPTLSVTGNTTICQGSVSNLTAGGASTYTWNTGENTATISVTPTVTTSYTVSGDNGNGCVGSLAVNVSVIPSKGISGVITSTAGATTGDVILYKYVPALSLWDSVTTTTFNSGYTFNNIDSALYVVKAVPTATNIQVTYGDSAISWQNAKVINHGCTNNTNQNIKLFAFENYTLGLGILTGSINKEDGFGQRTNSEFKPMVPGGPIGGIIVKGGKNPGGQMLVQTTTNAAGEYTLRGLPFNTVGVDEYFILVDLPGLDTNGTYYHIVLTPGNPQVDGLNFFADSMYVYPVSGVTSVNEQNALNNKAVIFPNPASQLFTIQYELAHTANVVVNLYDLIGNKVKEIVTQNRQDKNTYNYAVNTDGLSSGVYFVKLKINNSEQTIKLILTK